ncbi:MAG: hypothetical protein IT431_15240 [Phycisphaerales bacterium]|nr:hypothetical protein [Phycisphaerales bacterium]
MLRRSPRRVGSLLAAAAAFAGVQGMAALPALAQSEFPTVGQELAAPGAVIERAQKLADEGKLVHAYEMLRDLLGGGGATMTDEERAEAMTLTSSVNRRISVLDSYEVSLQKAEYALATDDLKAAAHHARAVATSGTAQADQAQRATDLIGDIDARRATLEPVMRSRLAEAVAAMRDGDYAGAKRGLQAVSRSGVDLTDGERESLLASQEQILLLEASRGERFDSPVAAAGVLQPGVVTRQDESGAGENSGQQAESQPETQPTGDSQDFLQVARRLEAGAAMAEADDAFLNGRWAEARAKYQRALSEFGDLLDGNQTALAQSRVAEAQINMGAAQPKLLDTVISDKQIEADMMRTTIRTQLQQAQRALDSGDTDAARDQAAQAQLTWASSKNKQLFSETELAEFASLLDQLRSDINLAVERNLRAEQATQESSSAEQARIAALNRERERARKITEAIDRARALQAEMKYTEALEVVESQILFLDPINPAGLLLRDTYRDILIYQDSNSQAVEKNFGIAEQQKANNEAFIPPPGIVDYPTDWPALSAMRAGVESMHETPADRRVLAALENTTLPAQFNDNTLEQALTYFAQLTTLDMDIDWQSLEEIGIDRETTVSLSLKQATAQTVLDRLLDKVSTDPVNQADWAVVDGMLQIASDEKIRRNTVLEIYDIRDLVFEVPDYDEAPTIDLQSVLQSSQGGGGGQSPFQNDQQDQQRDRLPLDERIDQIKEIIYTNIDPESWPEGGGTTGAMFDLNSQLLIKNTPKNHREIRGLLSKLRESKAMQINVETRFLLVAQDFFEQIGFDLDVYFGGENNQFRAASATDNTVLPSDFFDFGQGGLQRVVGGAGTDTDGDGVADVFTSQGVVNPTPWSPIGTGQNSLGLASSLMPGEGIAGAILGEAPALGIAGQFLDDVQVDFLIQATQADRRSVQLTAPRLTFTNGQVSNIYVVTQNSFVSDLQPVVSDSAVGFDPTLAVAAEGVVMLVEGQVTADRRYVLINIDTSVSQIEGFATQPVTAVAGGQLVTSSDTQSFIQLPTVTVTRVQTTVTVPDQGTVLLGGQRLINETEVETGVPVLSKIPILNRFFSNRIEAREEQTLLILIKPTILIQSEQEESAFPGLNQTLHGLGG